MRSWMLLSLLVLCVGISKSYSQIDTNEIRISDINNYKNIINYSKFYISDGLVSVEKIPTLRFEDSIPVQLRSGFAANAVDRNIYIQFKAFNNTDSIRKLFFFPGIHFNSIELFKKGNNGRIIPIPIEKPPIVHSAGYRLLSLDPQEHTTLYARVRAIKAQTNFFRPRLINAENISLWQTHFRNLDINAKVFSLIIAGMLLMMIFYAFINYFQTFQKQFLYYSLYAFGLAVLFFLYAVHNRASTAFNFFLEGYFDLVLQLSAHFFHFLFIQAFLNTAVNFHRLHNLLRYSQIIVVMCLCIYSWAYFNNVSFVLLNHFENGSKYFLLVFGIMMVFTGLVRKDKLLKYLMLGYSFLILLSVFSLLMAIFHWQPFPAGSVLNRSLVLYEVGIVIELIFFLVGLSYKNRNELILRTAEKEKFKLDNERKELDKQIAIIHAQKEERNRISVDMHDELGAGMTAIRLMSELALNKSEKNARPELEKISASANDLLIKMNAIIWSMSQSSPLPLQMERVSRRRRDG